ncbi:MAG: hypothetical protein WC549_02030 [Actinomycetota bacterium]
MKKIKNWVIRTFALRGSWSWAKKQMMKGKIVRCKHWTGALKYKIESPDNPLLLSNFTRSPKVLHEGDRLWKASNHHLSYEDFTDYEIFEWGQKSEDVNHE